MDDTKSWKPDSMAGMQVNFDNWISYEVTGNTATQIKLGLQLTGAKPAAGGHYQVNSQSAKFGWLRCSDLQSPYSWQGPVSAYLREYWDPATPEPFKNWTSASILLAPQPNNPQQGGQSTHGWQFFKRFYYESGNFNLKPNQPVTQHYLIQLGTHGDSLLPDLSSDQAAKSIAEAYRHPPQLDVSVGMVASPDFDYGTGAYRLTASAGRITFSPKNTIENPVLEIAGMDAVPTVKISKGNIESVAVKRADGTIIIQLWGTIAPGAVLQVSTAP